MLNRVSHTPYQIIVIASIHQPSTSTFNLFDQLYLLSAGQMCYGGPVDGVQAHFAQLGDAMPPQINPAEFLLELVNVSFSRDRVVADHRLARFHTAWEHAARSRHPRLRGNPDAPPLSTVGMPTRSPLGIPWILMHRLLIKSYRDVVVYGIRVAMYLGMSISLSAR